MPARSALPHLSVLLLLLACGAPPLQHSPGPEAEALVEADEDTLGDAGADDLDILEDEDPGDALEDVGDAGVIEPEDPPEDEEVEPDDDLPPDTGPQTPAWSAFSVASWNANYNNPVSAVVAHVRTIDADVIGLQELGKKQDARRIVDQLTCATCAWRAFHPQADNAHACPILWKKEQFRLLASGHQRVNERTIIHDGGSRSEMLVKSTVWVKLESRVTGARFFVSNNHLVASVEGANGHPRASASPARLALYRQHMDGIVSTIERAKRQKLPIFVTGDFNVDFRKDRVTRTPMFPSARFAAHDVFANWKYLGAPAGAGTHHARLIDSVHVTRAPAKVRPMKHAILGKGGSDHSAVRMRVRLYR